MSGCFPNINDTCKHGIMTIAMQCFHCDLEKRVDKLECQFKNLEYLNKLNNENDGNQDVRLKELAKSILRLEKHKPQYYSIDEETIQPLIERIDKLEKLRSAFSEQNKLDCNGQFDWKLFKEILQGIVQTINSLCKIIPDPVIRNIVCGIASIIQMVINMIPVP